MKSANLISVLGFSLLLLGAAGCQQQGQIAISKADTDRSEVAYEDFFDRLVRQPKCSVADACRGVAILIAGKDIPGPYQARYDYLLQQGIVRSAWNLHEDQWIDRGTLAYMLCKAIKMPRSLNMLLFGSWGLGDRRYAYRQMLYYDMMQKGVDYSYVSGPELVTAVGMADGYMEEHGQYIPKQKVELGQKTQY